MGRERDGVGSQNHVRRMVDVAKQTINSKFRDEKDNKRRATDAPFIPAVI